MNAEKNKQGQNVHRSQVVDKKGNKHKQQVESQTERKTNNQSEK